MPSFAGIPFLMQRQHAVKHIYLKGMVMV